MKLIKTLRVAFVGVLGATILTGCGGGGTTSGGGDPGEIKFNITEEEIAPYKSSPVSLSFWSSITGPDAEYFHNIVKGWNDKYGSAITIQSDPIDEDAHYTRILTSFTDNSTADICFVHKQRLARFQRTGKMRDMTNIVAKAGLDKTQYLDGAWDKGIIDNKMYGLIVDYLPTMLYYNKKLIPEGYTEADILSDTFTYEKMCEMMQAAYKYSTVASKRTYGCAFNYAFTEQPWLGNLYSIGGAPVKEDKPKVPLYNDAKSFEAVKAIESIPFTLKDGNKVASESGSDHRKIFKAGRSLFTIDGSWSMSALYGGSADKVEPAMTFMPKVNATGKRVAFCNVPMFATFTNKNVSEFRDGAIALFIKYFVGNSVYWCKSGQVACRKDTASDPAYKALDWSFFSDHPESLVTAENVYTCQTITAHAAETISEICEGKSGARYTDQEIQQKLDNSVQEAINLIEQL